GTTRPHRGRRSRSADGKRPGPSPPPAALPTPSWPRRGRPPQTAPSSIPQPAPEPSPRPGPTQDPLDDPRFIISSTNWY
uniref:Uncharacterized protein n=1 Tax=Malurus cyaneus samueli TaxID=2593467 RepID=A0A8C5TX32_9PASS